MMFFNLIYSGFHHIIGRGESGMLVFIFLDLHGIVLDQDSRVASTELCVLKRHL